jgi:hypothetical protein
MGTISRRDLFELVAVAAAAGAVRASAQGKVGRPARVGPLVAERVPERFVSLAFEGGVVCGPDEDQC